MQRSIRTRLFFTVTAIMLTFSFSIFAAEDKNIEKKQVNKTENSQPISAPENNSSKDAAKDATKKEKEQKTTKTSTKDTKTKTATKKEKKSSKNKKSNSKDSDNEKAEEQNQADKKAENEKQSLVSPLFEERKKQREKEKEEKAKEQPEQKVEKKFEFDQKNIYNEFLSADLHDKVLIVNLSDETTPQDFYEKSLRFCFENFSYLESKPDFYPLVLSSISHLNRNASSSVDDLLFDVYNKFEDYNVRLSVLKAFSVVNVDNPKVYDLMYSIVSEESLKTENVYNDFFIASLNALGNIKNPECFELLFTMLTRQYPPEINKACFSAICALAPKYNNDALYVAENGDIREKRIIFDVVTKNPQKDENFASEIAEILLSKIIIGDEGEEVSKAKFDLQKDCLKVLTANKWTKATSVVLNYFENSKRFYKDHKISEADFIEVINSLSAFPTTETCRVLTDFLTSEHSENEKNGNANSNVLVAVINALGDLGDNKAFDTLLYINSSKGYSEQVIKASSEALRKLKW